jgi:hypothetical protein
MKRAPRGCRGGAPAGDVQLAAGRRPWRRGEDDAVELAADPVGVLRGWRRRGRNRRLRRSSCTPQFVGVPDELIIERGRARRVVAVDDRRNLVDQLLLEPRSARISRASRAPSLVLEPATERRACRRSAARCPGRPGRRPPSRGRAAGSRAGRRHGRPPRGGRAGTRRTCTRAVRARRSCAPAGRARGVPDGQEWLRHHSVRIVTVPLEPSTRTRWPVLIAVVAGPCP